MIQIHVWYNEPRTKHQDVFCYERTAPCHDDVPSARSPLLGLRGSSVRIRNYLQVLQSTGFRYTLVIRVFRVTNCVPAILTGSGSTGLSDLDLGLQASGYEHSRCQAQVCGHYLNDLVAEHGPGSLYIGYCLLNSCFQDCREQTTDLAVLGCRPPLVESVAGPLLLDRVQLVRHKLADQVCADSTDEAVRDVVGERHHEDCDESWRRVGDVQPAP